MALGDGICRGMTFGFYARVGVLGSSWAREQVDKMCALGIDWVVLCPTVMQDSPQDTMQYRDFEVTPRDDEVINIIKYMQDKKINVMLRPMMEAQDGKDRLGVWFPNDGSRIPGRESHKWADWFNSMRKRSVFYATIAQELGCAAYGLDSELDRTVHQHDNWKRVIEAVRKVYSGHVTSCHTRHCDFRADLDNRDHWWYELDSLSCSFYHPGADQAGASVQEMADRLREDTLVYYREVSQKFGKPFYFGECGCTSSTGGAMSPAAWQGEARRYGPQEQANYLDAVCSVYWNEPWWKGLFWWKWDEQNLRPEFNDDPAGDKGFTVDGKLAADVMKRWYTRT